MNSRVSSHLQLSPLLADAVFPPCGRPSTLDSRRRTVPFMCHFPRVVFSAGASSLEFAGGRRLRLLVQNFLVSFPFVGSTVPNPCQFPDDLHVYRQSAIANQKSKIKNPELTHAFPGHHVTYVSRYWHSIGYCSVIEDA
jgi:hypothetical protein